VFEDASAAFRVDSSGNDGSGETAIIEGTATMTTHINKTVATHVIRLKRLCMRFCPLLFPRLLYMFDYDIGHSRSMRETKRNWQ